MLTRVPEGRSCGLIGRHLISVYRRRTLRHLSGDCGSDGTQRSVAHVSGGVHLLHHLVRFPVMLGRRGLTLNGRVRQVMGNKTATIIVVFMSLVIVG